MVPTVKATIASLGLVGAVTRSQDVHASPAIVVVAARSREALNALPENDWKHFHDGDGIPVKHPWTDDYINVIEPWLGSR